MESQPPAPATLTDRDASFLQVLAVCYYIHAGACFLIGCVPVLILTLGLAFHADSGFQEVFEPPRSHEEMQEDVLYGGESPHPPEDRSFDIESAPEAGRLVKNLFIGLSVALIVLAWAMAAGLLVTGRSLQLRTRRFFCQLVAGISCLSVPVGTALGVFTFIVLNRPSVAATFAQQVRAKKEGEARPNP